MFTACAVTRSKYKLGKEEIDLSDSFLCGNDNLSSSAGGTESGVSLRLENLPLSRVQLVESQKMDASLSSLFERAVDREVVGSLSTGFYVEDGLLMRKYTPPCASPADDWCVSTQIVVPCPYQSEILGRAHENPLAGHLGVRKTLLARVEG